MDYLKISLFFCLPDARVTRSGSTLYDKWHLNRKVIQYFGTCCIIWHFTLAFGWGMRCYMSRNAMLKLIHNFRIFQLNKTKRVCTGVCRPWHIYYSGILFKPTVCEYITNITGKYNFFSKYFKLSFCSGVTIQPQDQGEKNGYTYSLAWHRIRYMQNKIKLMRDIQTSQRNYYKVRMIP